MEFVDIFYNNIIKEAQFGFIDCDFIIRIIFNTLIVEDHTFLKATDEFPKTIIPTLMIKNKKEFNTTFTEYLNNALLFYDQAKLKFINNPAKYLSALAIANMTSNDFANPTAYFSRLTKFLQDQTFSPDINRKIIGYSTTYNATIEMSINKEYPNQEAPYAIQFFLTRPFNDKKNLEYKFPKIRFGIADNTAYIFAIQNEIIKQEEILNEYLSANLVFQKEIKRKNYKVNENIKENHPLMNVNPSALIALTLFLRILENENINNIVVSFFYPQRWNDKEIKYSLLENEFLGKILTKDLKTRFELIKKENMFHAVQMENIMQKLINAVLRFNYHFPKSIVENESLKATKIIKLNTQKVYIGNNPLLNEIYLLAKNIKNEKHLD
ncbi:MAG: hypothetical protein E7172_00725 [Firmicutes bacterium]|nr:hypothetical protein [Bacillota bacterium]